MHLQHHSESHSSNRIHLSDINAIIEAHLEMCNSGIKQGARKRFKNRTNFTEVRRKLEQRFPTGGQDPLLGLF